MPEPANTPVPTGVDTSAVPAGYSVQQFTQVSTAIPPHVWTTEALMDLHKRQQEVMNNNVRSLDDQRGREHRLAWAGFGLVGAIVLVGLYMMLKGDAGGKELIAVTVAFLSGYLAGQGQARAAK